MAGWDTKAELLAGLIEVVDMGNRMFIQANSKKGTKPPEPIEIRRPARALPAGEPEAPKVVSVSSPEGRAFFGGGDVIYTPGPTEGGEP